MNKVEIKTIVDDHLSLSHGGPAVGVWHRLFLNDLLIQQEFTRIAWDQRNNPAKLKPPGHMVALSAMIEKVLQPKPIDENTPKDRPILAYCNHDDDNFESSEGRLTLYAAHCEGLCHAGTGWRIIEWGGGWSDGYEDGGGSLPDWWFVADSEFEVAANPVLWMELPEIKK